VDATGSTASDADLDHIDLELELRDQQQVYVPRQRGTNPPPSVSSGALGSDGPAGALVNINAATMGELGMLPCIGPTLAQRIMEYREAHGPFEAIEYIQNVSGISPVTFEGLRDLITVGA
jgi:competence protein ComEA